MITSIGVQNVIALCVSILQNNGVVIIDIA
jgi:hypothetical protein